MGKTGLIIKREFLTRVRKRSFIVMSILGPLLMAAMLIVPIYVATLETDEERTINVLDETGWFHKQFKGNDKLTFNYIYSDLESAKKSLIGHEELSLLYIPKTNVSVPQNAILYSEKQPNIQILTYLENVMEQVVKKEKLKGSGVDPQIINSIEKTVFDISTFKVDEGGEETQSHTGVTMVLGIFAGILIYFFIFIFGALVMRGVIEEKSNRIVEIIISSVKPFQLMMGKVIGIAMVGLTQFLIWVVFTFSIVTAFTGFFSEQLPTDAGQQFSTGAELFEMQKSPNAEIAQDELTQVFDALFSVNYGVMIFSFLVYFIGGYLLYAALMAAIGSAVDNETDTQQFMLPVTIPMIFSIIMAQFVINNPDSSMAFWLSMIPLTSPVIMMVRIPFGVPYTELALSMGLLILGFLGAIWLAGKIYRTGILMYGSKVNYKTLWKWIRMKN